jgi:hypothetical protein
VQYITLLITLPMTAFAVLFAVSNPQDAELYLFPGDTAHAVPMYFLGLGLLVGGFFLGAFFVGLHTQKTQFRYWREKARAEKLEKELDDLHQKNDTSDFRQLLDKK